MRLATIFLEDQQPPWAVTALNDASDNTMLRLQRHVRPWQLFQPTRIAWHFTRQDRTTTIRFRYFLNLRQLLLAHAILLPCLLTLALVLITGASTDAALMAGCSTAIVLAALLIAFVANPNCPRLTNAFCKYAYDTTGETIPLRHGPLSGKAGSATYLAYAIILVIGFLAILLADKNILTVFLTTGFFRIMLVLIAYTATLWAIQAIDQELRHLLPYLIGVIALGTYTSWPTLDAAIPEDAIIYRLLAFAVITTTTTFFLWLATHYMHRVRNNPDPFEVDTSRTRTTTARIARITMHVTLWAVTLDAQYQALIETIARRQRATGHDEALTIAWAAPLVLATITLLWRATQRTITLTKACHAAPRDLRTACARNAQCLSILAPRVAITSAAATHAEHHPLLGPVIIVGTNDTTTLSPPELDALLLHELAHLKHHARLLCILDVLGTLTLCGRGIITSSIDARRTEFEADRDATRALDRLYGNGNEIMQAMIPKAARNAPRHEELTSLALLDDLFFGTSARWYQHPYLQERLQALRERDQCPA